MSNPPRRWRPSPFIYSSVALHGGALAAMALAPASWPLAAGAIVADQLLLSTIGLWPRSTLLGPNLRSLPVNDKTRNAVAITIDDGPDPVVTPQVLKLLDQTDHKATFFCIGRVAQEYPDLVREIVRRGHAIENHSQNHNYHFATFGLRRMEREVREAQQCLTEISGQVPLFFRPTAGLRSPLLEPVLARHGLHLASWTRRGFDTRVGCSDTVSARLLRNIQPRDVLLLHDGNAAQTQQGQPVILEVLPRLLDALDTANLHSITLRSALV